MKSLVISGGTLKVSEVGFGTARLAAGESRRNIERLLRTCVDAGVSYFDTAPMYGSERILGEFFDGDPSVIFATKVGLEPIQLNRSFVKRVYRCFVKPVLSAAPVLKQSLIRRWNADASVTASEKLELSADYIHSSVERSLKLLRRTSLDILLLHEPDRFFVNDDLVAIFENLREQGIIKNFGLAYGRPLSAGKNSFGQLIQVGFSASESINDRNNLPVFYHGVVRHALSKVDYLRGRTLRRNLKEYFEMLRFSPKIISASYPYQLKRVFDYLV